MASPEALVEGFRALGASACHDVLLGSVYDVRFEDLRIVVSDEFIFESCHTTEVAVILGGVQVVNAESGRFRTFLERRCPTEFVIGETYSDCPDFWLVGRVAWGSDVSEVDSFLQRFVSIAHSLHQELYEFCRSSDVMFMKWLV
jgi:hypothetical protein